MAADPQRRRHARRQTIDVLPQSILKSDRSQNQTRAKLLAARSRMQSTKPTTLPPRRASASFSVGQAVSILHGRFKGLSGVVKFAGETKFAKGVWLGIELSEPKGHCDGSRLGHQYFKCKPKTGVFVKSSMVDLCGIAPPKLPLEEVSKRRRNISWSTSPDVMQSPRVYDLPMPGSIPEVTAEADEEDFDRQLDDFKQQTKSSIRSSLRSWMKNGVRKYKGVQPEEEDGSSRRRSRSLGRYSTETIRYRSRERQAIADSVRESPSSRPRSSRERLGSRDNTKLQSPSHHRRESDTRPSMPTRAPPSNPRSSPSHKRSSPPQIKRRNSSESIPEGNESQEVKASPPSQGRWRVNRRSRSKSLSRLSAMRRTAAYSLPPSNVTETNKDDHRQIFAAYIASLKGAQTPTGKARNPLKAAQEAEEAPKPQKTQAQKTRVPTTSPKTEQVRKARELHKSKQSTEVEQPQSRQPSSPVSDDNSPPATHSPKKAQNLMVRTPSSRDKDRAEGFFDFHIVLDGETVASRPSKSEPTTPGGPDRGSTDMSPGWSYLDMAGANSKTAELESDVLNLNASGDDFSLITPRRLV